jgi:hypothetical protein
LLPFHKQHPSYRKSVTSILNVSGGKPSIAVNTKRKKAREANEPDPTPRQIQTVSIPLRPFSLASGEHVEKNDLDALLDAGYNGHGAALARLSPRDATIALYIRSRLVQFYVSFLTLSPSLPSPAPFLRPPPQSPRTPPFFPLTRSFSSPPPLFTPAPTPLPPFFTPPIPPPTPPPLSFQQHTRCTTPPHSFIYRFNCYAGQ